jgi:hypothetical protein
MEWPNSIVIFSYPLLVKVEIEPISKTVVFILKTKLLDKIQILA